MGESLFPAKSDHVTACLGNSTALPEQATGPYEGNANRKVPLRPYHSLI